jgi:hypothetical protein
MLTDFRQNLLHLSASLCKDPMAAVEDIAIGLLDSARESLAVSAPGNCVQVHGVCSVRGLAFQSARGKPVDPEQPRGCLPAQQHTMQDHNRWTAYWQAIMQVCG